MKSLVLIIVIMCASVAHGEGVETVWTYAPPSGYVDASPGVADLNGDGHPDLVIGTTAGMIIALSSDAQELWRQEMRGPISVPPSIGDLTGQEGLEVLVMNRQGQLRCLAGSTGDLVWETSIPGRLQWGETVLALGDVNGDGALEIVTGDQDGVVVCLNGAGELVWQYRGQHGITQAPALADLTGDGMMEVLVGGNLIPLVCLSHEGKELWKLDSGIGGNPLVYDITKDGTPEILIGVGVNLTVLDAKGAVDWTYQMQREMDGALTVADANEDGEVEIYLVDLAGKMVCLSPLGQLRWEADVEERVRRSPSVGDVDGDGKQEILVAGYSNTVHVFEPDGRLDTGISAPGGINSTATLLPMMDGAPGIVLTPSNDAMRMFRFPGAKSDAVLLWPEYQYDSRRNGYVAAASKEPVVQVTVDFGNRYVGTNLMTASVDNPDGLNLEVRLEAVRDNGAPSLVTATSDEPLVELHLSYTVPANQAGNLTLNCIVAEGNRVVARRSHTAYVVPFMKELGDAERTLKETDGLIATLADKAGLEERACFLRLKLDDFRPRILTAGAGTESDHIELRNTLQTYLPELSLLRSTAVAAAQATEAGSTIFARAANPWAPFGGLEELTEGREGEATLAVEAFGGETESAALNLFNLGSRDRTFRVTLEGLKQGDTEVPARNLVSLHEAVAVPTEMRDFSEDAIPLLNSANLIQVGAWDARQLWLNISTQGLTPGEWTGSVHLRSLDIEPVSISADIKLMVWAPKLPDTQPLSLCHWGYVHSSVLKDYPDAALADQVRNGTNVFVGLFYPRAEYNEQGELIDAPDFTDHDAYVKRHAPHGTILFCGYQGALKGPGGQDSEAYAKAHVAWLRAWVAHLKELGVGYDGFALYPVDEPGLSDGLVELYLRMAKLAREADPSIQMYTDPVARITEDELKEMLPYVDIWCPNRRGLILDKTNAAKLEIIKNSGATVWTYECDSNAKHQSPLGYYRAQAWLAWHHGMTGIGFWSYCTSQDDPWFLPTLRHDYLMVYPGNGVVSSKRWEAVRDGVEDYSMLAALRDRVNQPPATATPEDLETARALLGAEADAVALFCGMDGDDTLPGADGLAGVRRVTDARWEKIRSVRQELAALLTRLTP